jgi:hypothetical protein
VLPASGQELFLLVVTSIKTLPIHSGLTEVASDQELSRRPRRRAPRLFSKNIPQEKDVSELQQVLQDKKLHKYQDLDRRPSSAWTRTDDGKQGPALGGSRAAPHTRAQHKCEPER